MRVLIVKLGAIGDVLRTTSILRGLKERHPAAQLDWITDKTAREIFTNNSLVDQLYIWEERGGLGGYDLVIGLEDDHAACELATRLNPKKRLGTFVENGKIVYSPSAWFDMSAVSKFGLETANSLKKQNRKTYQQHMADLLGIKVHPYVFKLDPDEIGYGQKYVRDLGITRGEKVFGINTGAGKRWRLKALDVEKTIELVKWISKELGVVPLILGGEEEKERNALICKETGMPNGGIHSLRKFAAVVNQCQLVVSSDSLAMHFAIALNKRVVAFFGPTSPFEIELYGLGTKVFSDLDCLVCYKKECERAPDCMKSLAVDTLFNAVRKEVLRL